MLKKHKIKIVIAVLCVGIASTTLGFYKNGQDHQPGEEAAVQTPRPVKYMVLKNGKKSDHREFPGMVHVAGETRLSFRVSGPIEKVYVATGQSVKQGDLIAQIDARDFNVNRIRLEASLEEAQATLLAMENGARQEDIDSLTAQVNAGYANLVRSRNQKLRFDKLIQSQFITKEQHDQVIADFKTSTAQYNMALQALKKARNGSRVEDVQAAKARIKQLKANIVSAENALDDTLLKAPFDGIINQRMAEKFDMVSQGQAIVSILDVSTIDIKIAIPEEILLKRSKIKKITCTLDAYPERTIRADIKEIGLKTDSANQSFPLTVSLKAVEKMDIQAGMTAAVKIEFDENQTTEPGFIVPATTLFSDERNRLCAWKIDTDKHTVSSVMIRSRRLVGDQIFISSELKKGDLIVTAGAKFLIEGKKIRLMNEG